MTVQCTTYDFFIHKKKFRILVPIKPFLKETWCFVYHSHLLCEKHDNTKSSSEYALSWKQKRSRTSFFFPRRLSPFCRKQVFLLSHYPLLCEQCNNTNVTMTIFMKINQDSSWYIYLTYRPTSRLICVCSTEQCILFILAFITTKKTEKEWSNPFQQTDWARFHCRADVS